MWGRVAHAALMDRDNGEAGAAGQPPLPAFPKAFVEGFIEVFAGLTGSPAGLTGSPEPVTNQLFSCDLIRLSNSSKLASPTITSLLIKKVGVPPTFNTSLAYLRSAEISSSSA